MKKTIVRIVTAAALATTGLAAQAANVTLTGWAFGNGSAVQGNLYSGYAGGFTGALSGAPSYNTNNFLTYCIELEESFGFDNRPMTGYQIMEGARYFQQRRSDAGISDRLGRLMTYVADHPGSVDSAAESTSLQLAIWNLVYDTDFSLAPAGRFSDTSVFAATASSLLTGAQGVARSRFEVFALERRGTQDFVLFAPIAGSNPRDLPEPGSLALVALALAGAAGLRRRS